MSWLTRFSLLILNLQFSKAICGSGKPVLSENIVIMVEVGAAYIVAATPVLGINLEPCSCLGTQPLP